MAEKRGKRKKKKRRSEEGLYAVVWKGNTFMAYLYKLEQHSLRLSRNPGFFFWRSFAAEVLFRKDLVLFWNVSQFSQTRVAVEEGVEKERKSRNCYSIQSIGSQSR